MVAVPKNQAVTMLLGGSIGFAPRPNGATVANGQIYLFSGSVFNGGGTSSGSPGTGRINIGAPGATTITSAVFGDADGSILVGAITGNISFSGGEVVLEADPFDGTGDIKLLADNGHTLSFADDATMFDDVLLIAGNTIEISADHGGAITVAGGLDADAQGLITLFDDNKLGTITIDTFSFFASGIMGENADPNVNNVFGEFSGDANVDDINIPGTIQLIADGNLTATGTISGSSVYLYALGNLAVENVTATDPSGSAFFYADKLATFTGTVSSPNIFVTSADIDVVTGALLGVAGVTNTLALNAVNDLGMYIGDITAPAGAYTLNEDGDLNTRTLIFNAQSASDAPDPDIVVGDAHIDGSATAGGGITNIILGTGGSIHFNGAVNWTNAGASDLLTLNAGQNIELNTDTASYVMTNAAGALAGRFRSMPRTYGSRRAPS